MTYVITQPCIGILDTSCAEVCPVDCIHPGPGEKGFQQTTMLYIDPTECIDCSACLEVCPVDAPLLEADVPSQWESFTAINQAFYTEGLDTAERLLHDHLSGKGFWISLIVAWPIGALAGLTTSLVFGVGMAVGIASGLAFALGFNFLLIVIALSIDDGDVDDSVHRAAVREDPEHGAR